MNRRYIAAVAFLSIAGCATSGPEAQVADATAETPVITSNPAAVEGVMEQVDLQEAPIETTVADEDELICTREKLTGSRIATKVCLTRAEREKMQGTLKALWMAPRGAQGQTPDNRANSTVAGAMVPVQDRVV